MRKQVPSDESTVRALARGLDIVTLFGRLGPELSQSDIAAELSLPLPTVHRLTATLVERGFLQREPATRRLRLGLGLTRLLGPLLAGLGATELAREHVRRLAATTAEAANLAVLDGGEVVYVTSQAGTRLLTSQTPAGLRLPAHATALGKCLLAQLADDDARAVLGAEPYLQLTPRTRTRWPSLAGDLARARRDGLTLSEEEFEIGLVSLAVPVAGLGPRPAALNVSLPTSRATPAFRDELAGRLRETASALQRGLAAAAA